MIPKRSVHCAIYTRKSTEEGLEQDFNSLDAQREACTAYIASQKAEGWIALSNCYDDGGYSGGTLDRPALKQLLKAIEQGAVDVVVVYKIDRLSRSLMDFAKLVEVFDRKSVTFVSVTQSFNTTTSMGRLTLNVLLSFAQFEREVTGERIRDKFAASKKKGMWMGGNPPLGYDVNNRKLVVNQAEAETVRLIFKRYLDIGCVRLLCADLKERGVVSKHRTFNNGQTRGGIPIERSALFCILNNRAYIGDVTHKGSHYPGEHEGIVPRELYDAVQKRLAELSPPMASNIREPSDALFAGLMFDETGDPMLATYTKKKGVRYRYYVSRRATKGERSDAAISRIPAPPFEAFLLGVLRRLCLVRQENPIQVLSLIQRIDIGSNSIAIQLDRDDAMAAWRAAQLDEPVQRDRDIVDRRRELLESGETLSDNEGQLALSLPVRARFRGGRSAITFPGRIPSNPTRSDMTLIKALARAHHWRQMLLDGEVDSIEALAHRMGQDRGHVGLTLKLGFLSPAITRAIMRGEQPPGLRLSHLLNGEIPMSWRAQETRIQSGSMPPEIMPKCASQSAENNREHG
jgi:site-specific DNA recombinase